MSTAPPEASFQLPPAMSTYAPAVDDLYYFIYWLSVVFLVGITATAVYFSWIYRRRPGHKAEPTGHNTPLEVGWTVAPVFVLVFLFHAGFKGYMDMSVAPADAIQIRVRAFQWGWDFEYPNGVHSDKLRAPVHKPVKLVMSSNDVLHALFVPAFRMKRDIVPGMYTMTWFEATHTGEIDLFCAEYCGGKSSGGTQNGHWAMLSKVTVEEQDTFDKFMKEGGGPPAECGAQTDVAACWGEKLYKTKACVGCHSTTGEKTVGPTWKGIWGRHEEVVGSAGLTVDENYVRESILEPQAKLVVGFGPVMPTYKGILRDKEIDAIIAYMKTLK